MTVADWKEAEAQAVRMFGSCKLLVDGYNLTIGLRPKNAYKSILAVYINNVFEQKWCFEDCEIRKRFCRPVTSSLIKGQKQRDMLSKMSKKSQKEIKERMKFTYYTPYWNTFSTLKRHLIANNASIELVKEHSPNIGAG